MARPVEFPDRLELRLPDGWRQVLTERARRHGRPLAAEARAAIASYLGDSLPDVVDDRDEDTVLAEDDYDLDDLDDLTYPSDSFTGMFDPAHGAW